MANNDDETDLGEALSPIDKADTAMEVLDRMKREEAALATVPFGAAMRLPSTRIDLSRAPGVPSPAPSPAALQPVSIRLPATRPAQDFDPMDVSRRFGVPVDAAIRAETARRQFDAQQRIAAEGFTPEAISRYGMFAFPGTMARGMQPQIRAVPRGSSLVAYSPFGGVQTLKEAEGPVPAQVTYKELADGSMDIQTTQPTGHVTHHVIRKGQSTLEKAAFMDLQQAIKEDDADKIRDTIAYIESLKERRPGAVAAPRTAAPAAPEAPAGTPPSFETEADALASGVKGIVLIKGRRARID